MRLNKLANQATLHAVTAAPIASVEPPIQLPIEFPTELPIKPEPPDKAPAHVIPLNEAFANRYTKDFFYGILIDSGQPTIRLLDMDNFSRYNASNQAPQLIPLRPTPPGSNSESEAPLH